jgi:2-polyprenyl-6-methoxyphenol hydroxylase-like FAD-dependent oxidoreductase
MMKFSHAIVLGGSAAGLMSAAALSRFADRVTLIERDPLPDAPVHRKGTPQSRHANNLMARGVSTLEKLLPGIGEELVRAGATLVRDEASVVIQGVRLARSTGGPTGLLMTRALLDAVLRRRVRALGNVELRTGRDAIDLVLADDRRVAGVVVQGDGPLHGDLVVDAMGRGTRARRWLADRGFDSPPRIEVDVRVRYASRLFRRRAGEDALLLVGPTPAIPRGAVAFAVEDDRWLVTLYGYGDERPPVELDPFRRYALSLSALDIGSIVAHAEPLCEGATFLYPTASLHRFDRVRGLPVGYVCIGDALCNLNPSYGQGITTAAMQVEALTREITRGRDRFEPRYYARAVAAVKPAFEADSRFDAELPGVHAPSLAMPSLARAFMRWMLRAAGRDPEIAAAFLRVINLVDGAQTLAHPALIWRALSTGRGGSRGASRASLRERLPRASRMA